MILKPKDEKLYVANGVPKGPGEKLFNSEILK
jgi:hypothetical protein